jgi:hypothetical protein
MFSLLAFDVCGYVSASQEPGIDRRTAQDETHAMEEQPV